jgi:hypothetical protein
MRREGTGILVHEIIVEFKVNEDFDTLVLRVPLSASVFPLCVVKRIMADQTIAILQYYQNIIGASTLVTKYGGSKYNYKNTK